MTFQCTTFRFTDGSYMCRVVEIIPELSNLSINMWERWITEEQFNRFGSGTITQEELQEILESTMITPEELQSRTEELEQSIAEQTAVLEKQYLFVEQLKKRLEDTRTAYRVVFEMNREKCSPHHKD